MYDVNFSHRMKLKLTRNWIEIGIGWMENWDWNWNYLRATTKSIWPSISSASNPKKHLTGPLFVDFTCWIATPHTPCSKPSPKYLNTGLLSNLSDSRIDFSPGISNLEKHKTMSNVNKGVYSILYYFFSFGDYDFLPKKNNKLLYVYR